MVELLRKYWGIALLVGALIAFSDDLMAAWKAPKAVDELAKTVNEYILEKNKEDAKQNALLESQDRLLNILTVHAVDGE